MEVKKSPKANLENKKLLFREIGLIFTLLIVLVAFEWKSYEKAVEVVLTETQVAVEEETIPITMETPPPPAEAPKVPILSDQIDVMEDDIQIEDDFMISLEDTKDMGVEIMDYVAEVYEEEIVEEAIPFAMVESKPSFMGGDQNDFSKWVSQNLVYPEIAKENGVSGKVILTFTLTADGKVTNVKVLKGIDAALDKEAVRVVSSSPKWTPGKQRDRAVKVQFIFPVHFQLR